MKRILLAAVALATTVPALAAGTSSPPLYEVVNRPTNGISASAASTYTVAPNQLLLEAGYGNTSSTGSGPVTDYPQVLLHIGTHLKNLELDVKAPSEIRAGGTTFSDDVAVGLKYLFFDAKRLAVSAQAAEQLPTGSLNTLNSGSQTAYGLNGTYKISKMFEVRTTQSFTANNLLGVRYGSYHPSFTALAALPCDTQIFASYALNTRAAGPSTSSRSAYLLGASHQLNNHLQVDLEGTASPGANGLAKTRGIGFGAAYRI
jgi:hypothetical protein